MIRTRSGALLAELHAHTTWSDGVLPVPALVDLDGANGFDVLCVTDHVGRTTQLFSCVAKAGLPCVASGDFHRLEHLGGWKSVVPCARDEEALISHLRSRRPVFITEVGAEAVAIAA